MRNHHVYLRAYRILRELPRFKHFMESVEDFPLWVQRLPLQNEEIIIGMYENSLRGDQNVIVTNMGIFIFQPPVVKHLPYHEIAEILTPEHPEQKGDEFITVRLVDDKTATIPVKGKNGRFNDMLEFLHFLRRVTDHQPESSA